MRVPKHILQTKKKKNKPQAAFYKSEKDVGKIKEASGCFVILHKSKPDFCALERREK